MWTMPWRICWGTCLQRFMAVFRLIAMGLIFLGAGLTLDLVWNLSDVLMGVMVLINIPVIAILSRPRRPPCGIIPSSGERGRTPLSGRGHRAERENGLLELKSFRRHSRRIGRI